MKDALKEAGTGPSNTARLNIFVTDVDAFLAMAGDATGAIKADGTETAGTLIGVARLFDPDVMIELEATAVAGGGFWRRIALGRAPKRRVSP